MSSQVLIDQVSVPALDAFVRLLRAHAATTRALSADLVAEHGLTINDYEALLHLSRADDQRMRRVDLAGLLILTASGVTRLLDGLERAGYVEKATCDSDNRVTYAVLTDAGREAAERGFPVYTELQTRLFQEHVSDEEAELLVRIWHRVLDANGMACEPITAAAEQLPAG